MKDFKKIADRLFPDITKTPEDYFKLYPKRVLREGAEVTRTAPSPTGYYHIGGLYGAIIDKLMADTTDGVFYLRIEDTDQKREIKEACLIAYEALNYFGISPMEGYMGNQPEIGNYGPYVQSNRVDIYKAFAKHLVSIGRAYPCFCDKAEDKAEILERREKELSEGNLVDHDVCRNLTDEEVFANIEAGKPFAIRLLSMGDPNKSIKIKDEIKGDREIRENGKDIVILKSNGIPPYSLAHLVDDTLMGTTTVVRGEEWYQSLASHLELFDAFGYPHPKYAHTPVICKSENGNKRKISKRKDPEADSRMFRIVGYPKEAVVEYLITLLNSDFEDWRMSNPDLHYSEFPFAISKVGSNNPIFDFAKLNDISKNIIARYTAEKVYDSVLEWAKEYNKDFCEILTNNKEYAIQVFGIERGGEKPRKDIAKWEEVFEYYNYMFKDYSDLNIDFSIFNVDQLTIRNIINEYVSSLDYEAGKDAWFDNIKRLAVKYNFCVDNKEYKKNPEMYNGNTAMFCNIIRVAITGKSNTPDLYSICCVLGKKRLNNIAKSI